MKTPLPYTDLPQQLEKLDARDTGYQFDLEADIPWDRLDEPGLFLTADFVRDLGFDADALQAHPEAWEMFQWAAAIQICEGFILAEQDLRSGLRAKQTTGLLEHRSNQLLDQEEVKHIAMFRRLADHLRERQPLWVFDFDRHCGEVFAGSMFDVLDRIEPPLEWHSTFWGAVVYFEETTIYMHARLADAVGIQPTWSAAHRAHMREEVQHLLTDMAHVRALTPPRGVQADIAWGLLATIRRTLPVSFGSLVAQAMVAQHFPDLSFVVDAESSRTRVYQHIVGDHPVFRRTRLLLEGARE